MVLTILTMVLRRDIRLLQKTQQ